VSAATARRYLDRLERDGLVVRTHGGCVVAPGALPRLRQGAGAEATRGERRAIAAAAADMIVDDQTVIISSGRTALEVARHLAVSGKRLTVISNALDAINALVDVEGIELIVLGGAVRPHMHSMLGHLTALGAREIRADRLVMGVPAFDPAHGLTSDHLPEVMTDRALADATYEVHLVAESSKFGHVKPALLLPLSRVHTIITDDGLSDDDAQLLIDAGPAVVRVSVSPADQDT
jgi:DeoR/GlpR family transcriptional regulator of sugar metabolism